MNMGGYTYSLGGTLGALLYIIIKLLIVVLTVVVILGVIVWVRDNLFKNESSKFVRDIKNDPLLKAVAVITLAIVGVVSIFAVMHSVLSSGMNVGMQHSVGYVGYNPTFGIAGVLLLLIRVLMFVLVISLVLAGLTYLKDLYENGKLNLFASSNKNNNSKIIIEHENSTTETNSKIK